MRRLIIAAAALATLASACSTASQLDTSGPQTVDVDGITFSYECRGEGSPIAFVEDGLGMPEEMGFDPAWHGWDTALNGMAELTTDLRSQGSWWN